MRVLLGKFREVLFAVLPITLIVLVLHFTFTPLGTVSLLRFLLGAAFIVLGLTVFLFGTEIGIGPIGTLMGESITKSGKLIVVTVGGLLLGFFISVAEPDLHILAEQVQLVTSGALSRWHLVIMISIGIAVMMTLGMLRIMYNFRMSLMLTITYAVIAVLSLFCTPVFMAIAFDASGATTGAMTVPFILALALGVSHLKRDNRASENDSFGLVGITSTGAILGVLLMNILQPASKLSGALPEAAVTDRVLLPFLQEIPKVASEVLLALFPLLLIFLLVRKRHFKLSRHAFVKILKGMLYTYIGLVLFMLGVNAGFMEVGSLVGLALAARGSSALIIGTGFVLGLVTILAEPAVYVLTHQIEDVTSGYVRRPLVILALSLGVGAAVALSMLRILVPDIQLWHYLLPGFAISLAMSFFVPDLFVGIAFDSGGVASGPMTATFILAFAHGVAQAVDGADVLIDGFGMIAMVATMPLIALQLLGIIYQIRSKKGGITVHGNTDA